MAAVREGPTQGRPQLRRLLLLRPLRRHRTPSPLRRRRLPPHRCPRERRRTNLKRSASTHLGTLPTPGCSPAVEATPERKPRRGQEPSVPLAPAVGARRSTNSERLVTNL